MLKKRHFAVNILTAIPAILLSILLIACLLAAGAYGTVIGGISAKAISEMTRTTITQLVERSDFEEIILENEVVKENIEELDIPAEAVGAFMQSDAADEIIDLLSADAANLLSGKEEAANLTPEALVGIVKAHADDLAQMAADIADEPSRKEEWKTQIVATVEKEAEELTSVLPNVETIRTEIVKQVPVNKIARLLNPTLLWVAYGVCLLLAALIYACRCYRFGGFLWLGVDCLLAGGLSGGLVYAMSLDTAFSDLEAAAGIVKELVRRLIDAVQIRMWIYLGAGVLLIVGYTLLYTLVVKKKLAAAEDAMLAAYAPTAAEQAAAASEASFLIEDTTEGADEEEADQTEASLLID